ncbi:Pr6Pr family membrane protein [Microcella sp.]|uniref:Pr6Pr family membrane protein n=1 Tax=Microcella sp. TaxID=1913979 RepID=UPI0039191FB0
MTTLPPARPTPAGILVAIIRFALAGLTVAAVIATYLDAAERGPVNPLNFFGFFTIQSNILISVVWLWAAVRVLQGRRPSAGRTLLRAITTTFIVIVGIMFVTLLAPLGAEGGVPVGWANTVMHYVTPIAGALDWLLASDRVRLALRRLGWVLVYPTVWVTVVLVRGATDGWVPYPFLNPSTGYDSVFFFVGMIVLAFITTGAAIFLLSRVPAVLRVVAEAPRAS